MATTDSSLFHVDWSLLPVPHDDGATAHLPGMPVPDVELPASDGSSISLARLRGRTVVFAYPMTGTPGGALPDGWDEIPGARGCTPHACAFRDLHADLTRAGASTVFGLSTQTALEQVEAAERLHLPFALLSDSGLQLAIAMALPTMDVAGKAMIKRLALIIDDGIVVRVFYPVFPPDRNAADVLAWLKAAPR